MIGREEVLAVFSEPSRFDDLLERLPLRKPRTEFLEHDGILYGVKLVWSLAHDPVLPGEAFTTNEAKSWLKRLGFTNFITKAEADLTTTPGSAERIVETHKRVERSIWTRRADLRRKVLTDANYTCVACQFYPDDMYAGPRDGCLEAHHLRPMSECAEDSQSVAPGDLACLCANCHRMLHHLIVSKNRNVSIDEFRKTLKFRAHYHEIPR